MNWKKEAANDLRTYPQRKESVINTKERIKVLEEQYVSLKGISTDTPVMGGMSRQEEKMLDNIAERERLKSSLTIAKKLVDLTEKGLSVLDDKERKILEGFYFDKTDNNVERMCVKFHLEKTRLYELREIALKKFTIAMYGTVEI